MCARTHPSTAKRLGHRLGRLWRAYGRWERHASARLAARWGWSATVTLAGFWVVKAAAVLVLAYAAFWLLLLAAVVVTVLLAASRSPSEDEAPVMSFEDPAEKPGYDPWLYGDVAHPDYPHELDR